MFPKTTLPILALLAVTGALALGACSAPEERDVTTVSDEAYARYEEGSANMERFRFEKALKSFEDAVEHDPDFAMAWAHLGIVQRQLGDVEAAKASIARAAESSVGASEVEVLWIRRLNAIFERDLETAEAAKDELLEKYPDHPWALRIRADIAKQNNDFETAHACYDQLLEQDPDAVAVHNLKGYLYLSQGRYEDAVVSLQRYAYYASDEANPHDSLGEAYLYIGRYDDAIEEFRAALEIDSAFLWSARNLANALSITGQRSAAIKVLQNYRPLFEERRLVPWWDLTRSVLELRAERWDDLLQLTETSLKHLSELSDDEKLEYELFARYARTIALLELDRMEAAHEALGELARVAARVGDLGQNQEYERPRQIMEIRESMTLAHFGRAEGNPSEGIPRLAAALDAASLSPHELASPTEELAQCYFEAGEYIPAAAAAQLILDDIPTAPALNLVAAKAWARAGDREQALEHLQTYLDVMRNADPGLAPVEEATELLQQLVPRS